jgi:hypothetical protein
MSYIGSTPTTQSFIAGTDYFNGTGSQTAFTLSRNVVSANDIQATVNNVVQQPNDAYTVSGTTITFTSAPSAGTQNIYVRYLSTTTQSITPSQNTVSYSTLNTDLQSGGYASNFKNRLINGDMTFDQRNNGASVAGNNTGAYTLDRWRYFNTQINKFTVQQNAGSVTPPPGFTNYLGVTSSSAYSIISSDYFDITQPIEGFNTADLAWGTANAQPVTVSFWVRSSLTGTFGGGVTNSAYNRSYPFPYTINAANTWEYKTITIPGDTTGTWLTNNSRGIELGFGLGNGSANSGTANTWQSGWAASPTGAVSVVGTNGATWYITGVQLEKGSTATSFDYLSYGTELALCQRYFTRLGGLANYTMFGTGMFRNTTTGNIITVLPVQMRTSPTVTFSSASNFFVSQGTSNVTPSAINIDQPSPLSLMIDATTSATTTGNATRIFAANTTAAVIDSSAEL